MNEKNSPRWYEKYFDSKRPEHEFMAAKLEITESPPSPVGRIIIWTVSLMLSLFLIWACIGEVEIVATGTGKIVPSGKTKSIQSINTGKIKEILAKDGELIKKGDKLIILDSREIKSQIAQIKIKLNKYLIRVESIKLLLYHLDKPFLNERLNLTKNDFDLVLLKLQEDVLNDEYITIFNEIDKSNSSIKEKQSELLSTISEVNKYSDLLPIVKKKSIAIKTLRDKKSASEMEFLNMEEERIEIEYNLAQVLAKKESLHFAIEKLNSEKEGIIYNYKASLSKEKDELINNISSLSLSTLPCHL